MSHRASLCPAREHGGDSSRIGSLTLEEWLHIVDDEGYLQKYLLSLSRRFGSALEAVTAYSCDGGGVDPGFFEDFGVRKLGHRRLFEVWFRYNSACSVYSRQ